MMQKDIELNPRERELMKRIKPFAKGMEVYKKIFDCNLLSSEQLHSKFDPLHPNKKLTPAYNGYALKKIYLNPENWAEMWVTDAQSGA